MCTVCTTSLFSKAPFAVATALANEVYLGVLRALHMQDRGQLCKDVWEYGEFRVCKLELFHLRLKLLQVLQQRIQRVAHLSQVAPKLRDNALESREAFCDNFCGKRLLHELQVPVHTVEGARVLAQSEVKPLANNVM